MSGLKGVISTTNKVALTASIEQTILQVTAPAGRRIKITGFSVSFDEETGDATPAQPLHIDMGRYAGATGTGTAVTASRLSPGLLAFATAGAYNFTGVASITDYVFRMDVNPQTGIAKDNILEWEYYIEDGETFSINVTAGSLSDGGTNCSAYIQFEE